MHTLTTSSDKKAEFTREEGNLQPGSISDEGCLQQAINRHNDSLHTPPRISFSAVNETMKPLS
jgi:hypothetical protein